MVRELPPLETGTGNIETMGGCCLIGAGGCLGPTTAVTLTSDPDKALANSEAAKKRGACMIKFRNHVTNLNQL